MINGNQDQTFDKESAVLPLYTLAGEPKTILWAETGHQAPTPEHRPAIVAWLRENLQ
jgi:hypothetical protein